MDKQPNIKTELKLARDMMGQHLSPESRAAIQAVIDNPTEETWDRAARIIVSRFRSGMTLWQAVSEIRDGYTNIGPVSGLKGRKISGWKRIPDRDAILAGLKFATH
jgi:hypothetical protein